MLVNYTFRKYKDIYLIKNLNLGISLTYNVTLSGQATPVLTGTIAPSTEISLPIVGDGDYLVNISDGTDFIEIPVAYYVRLQRGLMYNIREAICNAANGCTDCNTKGLDDCIAYRSLFTQLISYPYFVKSYGTSQFCDSDCLFRSFISQLFALNKTAISRELYSQLSREIYTAKTENAKELNAFLASIYYLFFYYSEYMLAADSDEQAYINAKFYWNTASACITRKGLSIPDMAAIFTTANAACNQAPSVQSIIKTFSNLTLNQLQTYTFSAADFTTGFADPNGDHPKTVKILQNTFAGQLYYNGLLISGENFTFDIANAANLQYKFTITTSNTQFDKIFFQISDDNPIPKYSDMATITINAQAHVNQPPNHVGNNTITLSNRVLRTFTLADFTTNTSPAYSDPEGDAVYQLRVDSLPALGTLLLSSVPVTVGQIINASAIVAGQFQYQAPSQDTAASVSFNYSLSDTGSHTFVS